MILYPRIHPWKTCSFDPVRGSSAALAVCVKNTNYKHQITNKSQIPMFNDQNHAGRGLVWIFEFRSLEII
jgi:hypothetical protein